VKHDRLLAEVGTPNTNGHAKLDSFGFESTPPMSGRRIYTRTLKTVPGMARPVRFGDGESFTDLRG
jgi:hypothetical protein